MQDAPSGDLRKKMNAYSTTTFWSRPTTRGLFFYDFLDAHAGRVEKACVLGGLQRRRGPLAVATVALLKIGSKRLEVGRFATFEQLAVPALGADLAVRS